MKKVFRGFLFLIISVSFSFQTYSQKVPLKEFSLASVIIKGRIENYNSESKTVRLTHFDAVTRSIKDEVFAIDSSGFFEIRFKILHEVYGCVSLNIQNGSYKIYVEPQKSYNIVIANNNLEFKNSENPINDELVSFENALYNQLKTEIDKASSAHNLNYTIDDYVNIQKEIEQKKFTFLESYQESHPLLSATVEILKNNIRYETARAWICIRYDYSGKMPSLKDSLPEDFYSRIFAEYPINSNDGYRVRKYIDYIANIGEAMDNSKKATSEERLNFYKSYNIFSKEELKLIVGAYIGDTTVLRSVEFKNFNSNKDKMTQEFELRNRFAMNSIFKNCLKLPKGMGRDFILSQQIVIHYFEKNFSPTDKEWNLYNDFFSNKSILNYLKSISPNKKQITVLKKEATTQNSTEEYTKLISEKYFQKYLGKVIYIDFWATWCGSCKQEIPFTKMLHAEFENKNIVFINFCVKSEKEIWQKMITDEKIDGENYLLNEDEFNILSKKFNVNGYPTYILVGKDGAVANYSASRPSTENKIIEEINSLIK